MSITDRGVLSRRGQVRTALFDYLALTKPRSIHLVIGAVPAVLLAERGVVAPVSIVNALAGAILMTAGANTLNCVADADIDKLMRRTANRPLARGAISTDHALVFGLGLSVAAFAWLWVTTSPLAALLAAATIAFYVLIYTLLIKRRTSQNVVWGGIANGMPVLIGWSAVTAGIGWPALAMFAIIFFWTPPHSWALAMRRTDDCRAAGLPMLPAVASERHVATRIFGYTVLTVSATVALALATGWLYGAVALLAAVWLLATAHRLYARAHNGEPVQPLRLFRRSNNYLSAVFLALAVDSALGLPTLLGH
ncbi:heme o synthase [Mycobacterium sp. E3198]|uniref:heme o synthase n=1 Tax=Mycobacterium sp. E3198 TaxID=1834143 RepID=UPI0007FC5E39|nr:heme o synthase [Mycobacterium sp. E3198]OBG25522.1 protoheme IX farnesyltransferase [Mycobacterium sp. E3198]